MLRVILILIVSASVSACSSQARIHVAQEIAEEVLAVVLDHRLDHGEHHPFPNRSQRLACKSDPDCNLTCQLDAGCKTPLTESEVRRLKLLTESEVRRLNVLTESEVRRSDVGDQLRVSHDVDQQPRQVQELAFVALSPDYQDFLQRQSEIIEHARNRGPAVSREPKGQTDSTQLEQHEL